MMIGMGIHNPTPEQSEMMKALAAALGRLTLEDRKEVLVSIEVTVRSKDVEIERLTAENRILRDAMIEIGLTRDAHKARLIASTAYGAVLSTNQQSGSKEG